MAQRLYVVKWYATNWCYLHLVSDGVLSCNCFHRLHKKVLNTT